MYSQKYLYVGSIVWCILLVPITGDWVKIPQKNGARTDPLVGTLNSSVVHETPPISSRLRYEDLEHIIGPGFEEDLERFYEKHKKESSISTTTAKPDAHRIFRQQLDDPWSIYDKSPAIESSVIVSPKLDIKSSEANITRVIDDQKLTEINENSKKQEITIEAVVYSSPKSKPLIDKKKNNSTKQGRPQIVRIASVKQATPAPMSFAAIIKFLKSIQSTFVTTTARSIQEKIKMLEGFKDDLLLNIG